MRFNCGLASAVGDGFNLGLSFIILFGFQFASRLNAGSLCGLRFQLNPVDNIVGAIVIREHHYRHNQA